MGKLLIKLQNKILAFLYDQKESRHGNILVGFLKETAKLFLSRIFDLVLDFAQSSKQEAKLVIKYKNKIHSFVAIKMRLSMAYYS